MYFEVQQCVAVIRDAAVLHAGTLFPAAGAALTASRLPERLRALAAPLDLSEASDELAQALLSGEAAGLNAHRWLPLALTWLQQVVARY